ncbi:MAG: hypothetical protein AAGE59_02430 [Cyanobacteria bacterium P01_F01_bin.86]
MTLSAISKKLSTLANMVQDLRQGKQFNITRLTSMKSLCADSEASGQFCLHLAKLTQAKIDEKRQPGHLEEKTWLECKELIGQAVAGMENHLLDPTQENKGLLQELLSRAREINNKYENQAWGPVRIIQSGDVLLIEKALYGILQSSESSHWGYQIAREYAERYNSSYGTGLIPESAPMVEDIADFWCQYHFGQPLEEWLNRSKN